MKRYNTKVDKMEVIAEAEYMVKTYKILTYRKNQLDKVWLCNIKCAIDYPSSMPNVNRDVRGCIFGEPCSIARDRCSDCRHKISEIKENLITVKELQDEINDQESEW